MPTPTKLTGIKSDLDVSAHKLVTRLYLSAEIFVITVNKSHMLHCINEAVLKTTLTQTF